MAVSPSPDDIVAAILPFDPYTKSECNYFPSLTFRHQLVEVIRLKIPNCIKCYFCFYFFLLTVELSKKVMTVGHCTMHNVTESGVHGCIRRGDASQCDHIGVKLMGTPSEIRIEINPIVCKKGEATPN